MSKKIRPARLVRGSKDFSAILIALDKASEEHKAIDEALSVLKENVLAGDQVPKDRWPRRYVNEYGVNNLYKYDLSSGRRLTYTIVAEDSGYSAVILDYFRFHKEYEKFFGY
ncbi:MAG: hypothetical protein HYU39_04710 [Thaumarchaeota archaeon]|nr:hypothetical protein [Nitrososphaerota archaeon]